MLIWGLIIGFVAGLILGSLATSREIKKNCYDTGFCARDQRLKEQLDTAKGDIE